MTLDYLIAPKTNGANPFKIFEWLAARGNDHALEFAIKRMAYNAFLATAYWFGVSMTAKARAGMRCQVCNSPTGITTHHRTYDTHGKEHLHMEDLVVLCKLCHGMFHGHIESTPPKFKEPKEPRVRNYADKPGRVVDSTGADFSMPDGEPIILTKQLISRCRANGSFTNATLKAFGLKKPLLAGWPARLIGTAISRDNYLAALKGRFIYNSGPLPQS